MKRYFENNIIRKILIISCLSLFSILTSCEQDELTPVAPVDPNSCNTTNVSYATYIKPIIDAQCKGCHNSSMSLGGANLESYDNIKASGASGKLVKSIDNGTMYQYLNVDATQRSCDLAKVKAWVTQGMKNN
jgi:hypothetical protein